MSNITIVRAGTLVAGHDQAAISGGAVAVSGERIKSVGPYHELSKQYPGARTVGGDRFLLIPGLINGHGHGRGLTDFQRGALDNTLESWLLDTRKYIPISTYDDVVYSAARLLKSGVTTAMHNHILKDPAAFREEFDEGLKAYTDAGMRVQFNPGVRNDNPFVYGDNKSFLDSLPETLRRILTAPQPAGSLSSANFVEAVRALFKQYQSPMCRIGFGPLAPQWCTKDLLLEIRKAADELNAPIHVHAVQSIFQKVYGLRFLGKTLVQHMNDIGFLGRGVVVGHCVWPTEKDIEILAKTGTAVTHHPSCNLRVRNGISPAYHMLQAGVTVGLGLDGKSINDDDDMIQEMKICYLLHRLASLELHSPHMTARDVFKMTTENNAKLLGLGQEVGRLEPGRRADMVLMDYQKMCHPFVDPSHDPIDVLLYRGLGKHVHTVMVNGRIVVQDGKILTIDEEAIAGRLAEAASRPRTDKEEALVQAMDELKQNVIRYYDGWAKKTRTEPYFMTNSRIDGLL
jgi:5-methylthioadenosine/S-adenosylhomocysteine deaminase